jgi:hypothetical protein
MKHNPDQDTPQNRTLSSNESKVPVMIIRATDKATRGLSERFFAPLSLRKESGKAHRVSGEKISPPKAELEAVAQRR